MFKNKMVVISKTGTCGWLLAICMFFVSCKQKNLVFKEKETVKFTFINPVVYNGWFGKFRLFSIENKDQLAFYDKDSFKLHIYNASTYAPERTLEFSPELFDRFGSFSDYFIEDSNIYFLSYPYGKMLRIDWSGKLIHNYEVKNNFFGSAPDALFRTAGEGFCKFRDNFLLVVKNYGEQNPFATFKNEHIIHIKLSDADSSSTIVDHSGWYPPDYNINQISLSSKPCIALNDKQQLIYAFAPDKNLYIYDTSLVMKKIECPESIYQTINDSFDITKYGKDWDYVYFYGRKSSFYAGIFFDKYCKLYYRVYAHGRDKSDPPKDDRLEYYNRHFSIIIMDENFKKLGEHKFERNKYYFFNILPVPEGILLPKIEANSDVPATTAEFDLFEVVSE